jgi:hypothetical protein
LLVLNENLLTSANSELFGILPKGFVFVVRKMTSKVMAPKFSEPRIATIHPTKMKKEKNDGNIFRVTFKMVGNSFFRFLAYSFYLKALNYALSY